MSKQEGRQNKQRTAGQYASGRQDAARRASAAQNKVSPEHDGQSRRRSSRESKDQVSASRNDQRSHERDEERMTSSEGGNS
ncbi:hypothetical protein GCM10010191_88440 [Actinomadura vinacea]|uniref:Plasmid stabilization protein n=1 Tax=Actinomadura vinacea TaxID=115336 RepID=A0ABP5XKP7_9ACTN